MDVVITDNPHAETADVDVNMLTFGKDGLKVHSPPGMKLDLNTVIAHIKARVFQALPSCPYGRYDRMLKKGWTSLDAGNQLVTPEDIHRLADAAGIAWDIDA